MRATVIIPVRTRSFEFHSNEIEEGESVLRFIVRRCSGLDDLRVVMLIDSYDLFLKVRDAGFVECYLVECLSSDVDMCYRWAGNIDTESLVIVPPSEILIDSRDLNRLIDCNGLSGNSVTTLDREFYAGEHCDRRIVKLQKHLWGGVYCFTRSPLFTSDCLFRKHIPVYSLSVECLKKIGGLIPTNNGFMEMIDCVSWIENGVSVRSLSTNGYYLTLNTEENFLKCKNYMGYEKI